MIKDRANLVSAEIGEEIEFNDTQRHNKRLALTPWTAPVARIYEIAVTRSSPAGAPNDGNLEGGPVCAS
jgi:hypothetical protein